MCMYMYINIYICIYIYTHIYNMQHTNNHTLVFYFISQKPTFYKSLRYSKSVRAIITESVADFVVASVRKPAADFAVASV